MSARPSGTPTPTPILVPLLVLVLLLAVVLLLGAVLLLAAVVGVEIREEPLGMLEVVVGTASAKPSMGYAYACMPDVLATKAEVATSVLLSYAVTVTVWPDGMLE